MQVYVESGTQELFDEYRNVEFVRVVASEVASFDVSPQRFGDLAESGAVGDILVVDVVDGRGGLRNVHLRVDPARLDFLAAVGHYFDERYFDDAVFARIDAGGFQIEKDDRIFQVQFHSFFYCGSPRWIQAGDRRHPARCQKAGPEALPFAAGFPVSFRSTARHRNSSGPAVTVGRAVAPALFGNPRLPGGSPGKSAAVRCLRRVLDGLYALIIIGMSSISVSVSGASS